MTPAQCPTLHPTAQSTLIMCCFTFALPARLPGKDDISVAAQEVSTAGGGLWVSSSPGKLPIQAKAAQHTNSEAV